MANGLNETRLHLQNRRDQTGAQEIWRCICSARPKSTSDPDGALDWLDEILAELDIVVASIHSAFTRTKEQQTERLIRAIKNPFVNIIGHPTGALIEKRAGYEFDQEAVFRAAAETGTAMEINANPKRLDLNAAMARRAKALGCTISIDTDAHSIEMLDHMHFGVGTARKAGLTREERCSTRARSPASSHSSPQNAPARCSADRLLRPKFIVGTDTTFRGADLYESAWKTVFCSADLYGRPRS